MKCRVVAELVFVLSSSVFLAARAQKQWAIPTGVTMALRKQPAFWILGTEKTGSQEWTLQEVGVRRLLVAQIPGVSLPFWSPKHGCDSGGSREQPLAGPAY